MLTCVWTTVLGRGTDFCGHRGERLYPESAHSLPASPVEEVLLEESQIPVHGLVTDSLAVIPLLLLTTSSFLQNPADKSHWTRRSLRRILLHLHTMNSSILTKPVMMDRMHPWRTHVDSSADGCGESVEDAHFESVVKSVEDAHVGSVDSMSMSRSSFSMRE